MNLKKTKKIKGTYEYKIQRNSTQKKVIIIIILGFLTLDNAGQGLGLVLLCTKLVETWTYNKCLTYVCISTGTMLMSSSSKPVPQMLHYINLQSSLDKSLLI